MCSLFFLDVDVNLKLLHIGRLCTCWTRFSLVLSNIIHSIQKCMRLTYITLKYVTTHNCLLEIKTIVISLYIHLKTS